MAFKEAGKIQRTGTMTNAFDNIAAGYDQGFTGTATGRRQRAVVHRYLAYKIKPGISAFEINCGTGEDAVWLAQQSARVLTTDISTEMVTAATEKAKAAGLSHLIETEVLDIRVLQHWRPESRFDLILSNFGGLNCLSPEDMQALGAILPRLLQPGGLFVAVVMGRFCWWETGYFLLKGRWRNTFRRLSGGPVQAPLNEQIKVPAWYYSPTEFTHFFPNLVVTTIQPVGFWLPPSYLDPWFQKHPRWLQVLDFLEKKCRGRLWAWGADHFMLVFHS